MPPKKKKNSTKENKFSRSEPWLSYRSGLITVGIASIVLTIWIAWQGSYTKPLWESILWGILFGISIWIVFFIFLLINRFLKR